MKCEYLCVALTGFKLNLAVIKHMQRWEQACARHESLPTPDDLPVHRRHRAWSLHKRLSPDDIQVMIKDFKAGTSKRELSGRYMISISSVRALLA